MTQSDWQFHATKGSSQFQKDGPYAELRAVFPHQVLATRIRKNIRLAEAPSHAKTIFDYAPESSGARDYPAGELARALALAPRSRAA